MGFHTTESVFQFNASDSPAPTCWQMAASRKIYLRLTVKIQAFILTKEQFSKEYFKGWWKKEKWYLTHTLWKEYLRTQSRAYVGKGKITKFPRSEYLQENSKSLRKRVGVGLGHYEDKRAHWKRQK